MFFTFQNNICTFSSQNQSENLLELLLFRNVHHSKLRDNLRGRIFVSSVVQSPSIHFECSLTECNCAFFKNLKSEETRKPMKNLNTFSKKYGVCQLWITLSVHRSKTTANLQKH